MKKTLLVSLLICLCLISVFAQTGKKTSLFVKNCEETESICDTQHIFRYDFVDGEFVGKEKILTSPAQSGVRFDVYSNRIYRNRYLINGSGDVVDLSTGKILHNSQGDLLEIDGDNVVIGVNRVDVEGIFVYNLQTATYTQLKSPNIYEIKGVLSPDKKYAASKNYSKGLIFKDIKTGREKIVKGLFGVGLSTQASEFGKLPILWLDNTRVLTQNSNGDLRIVHINGKVERVVQIDLKNEPYRSPELYRNADGEVIYECFDSFVIDVENKKYSKYENHPLGDKFYERDDESVKNNWGTGSIFYYNKAEIGRIWAGEAATTNDYLAVIYGKEGTNLGYPDGVKVWNKNKRDWMTFEIKWSPEIIGWINK